MKAMKALSSKHLETFRMIVLDYAGILLERVGVGKIAEKIGQHMSQLAIPSPEDYFFLLQSKSGQRALDELMTRITVSESFFFRNPDQFRFLAREFLPRLLASPDRPGYGGIRILSAGCATGEETFSLAGILAMCHKTAPSLEISLVGTDINALNIEKATQGFYRSRSFRDQSWKLIRELGIHVVRDFKDGFQVEENLRRMVNFRVLNLKDEAGLKRFAGSDIIMCRNVLIYFPEEFRLNLIHLFHQLLNPDGMLFLGETESLPSAARGFELVPCAGAYGYRKCNEERN